MARSTILLFLQSKHCLLRLRNRASELTTRGATYPRARTMSMVTEVAAAASGLLLAWKICRMVKTHGSVVEITSRMVSKSILEIDSEIWSEYIPNNLRPVRKGVSYRGLFTAGWFGVRKKHYSQLKIYDRLRASEQTDGVLNGF